MAFRWCNNFFDSLDHAQQLSGKLDIFERSAMISIKIKHNLDHFLIIFCCFVMSHINDLDLSICFLFIPIDKSIKDEALQFFKLGTLHFIKRYLLKDFMFLLAIIQRIKFTYLTYNLIQRFYLNLQLSNLLLQLHLR